MVGAATSRTIFLIACVSKKHISELPAEELYCSDRFQKARGYALRKMKPGDEWFILSARHGLLHPRKRIEPYNETLSQMGKTQRLEWAQQVNRELRDLVSPGNNVVFLAGQKYREFIIPEMLKLGCQVSVPMEGLSIGKQLNWLVKSE